MLGKLFKNIGPGTLVAAAFIGPGTVTVCTLSGVQFGFTLLWAMLVSILATIVLQEMAARLGIITGRGLAETVKSEIKSPIFKMLSLGLIVAAILAGNAAYQAGNISGGVLGLQTIFSDTHFSVGDLELNYLNLIVGFIAFILLFIGNYKVIERCLVSLVIIMSLSFVITAILTQPSLTQIIKGMFTPAIPENGLWMVLGLVGTTVVPYNLFLHASLVKEKWNGVSHLKAARRDTYISIILGGVVSMAIIVCAAAIEGNDIKNAGDLAKGLEPLYGDYATYFLSFGLFAAGITSAITAPLAAAYVAKGCFGWKSNLKSGNFRMVWMSILFLGLLISSMGWKPLEIIKFAQVANALLLPIIACFLLWIVNKSSLMGSYKNSLMQNVLGVIIVLAAIGLGIKGLFKVFFL